MSLITVKVQSDTFRKVNEYEYVVSFLTLHTITVLLKILCPDLDYFPQDIWRIKFY